MFNKLMEMLSDGQLGEEEMGTDMPETDMLGLEDADPDEILKDPSASFEMKQQALQMIRDRYLKPRNQE